ncbi:MAG: 50S ribosomal protein L23 [Mycoplasmoidaceae bacterium]
MELSNVITKPYRTEKTYNLGLSDNKKKYAFVVHKKSTKKLISKAFFEIYNVIPESINILIKKPTHIRTGTKKPGWSKLKKIAYITLPKGVDIIKEDDSK